MEANEQLQQRLVSILDYVESSAKTATDFAITQATDVAQQIIYWNMAMSAFWALGILLIMIGVFHLTGRIRKWGEKYKPQASYDSDDEAALAIGWAGQVGSLAIGTIGVLYNCAQVVKLIVAPKLFLLEYVADLIKNSQ